MDSHPRACTLIIAMRSFPFLLSPLFVSFFLPPFRAYVPACLDAFACARMLGRAVNHRRGSQRFHCVHANW